MRRTSLIRPVGHLLPKEKATIESLICHLSLREVRAGANAQTDWRDEASSSNLAIFDFSTANAHSSHGNSAATSALLDGRAGPDAETRRRIAIIGDVLRRVLFVEQTTPQPSQTSPAPRPATSQSPGQ